MKKLPEYKDPAIRSDYEEWLRPTKSGWESRRRVSVADWKHLILWHTMELDLWTNGREHYPRGSSLADRENYIWTHNFWIAEYTKAMADRQARDEEEAK